ncbi:cytochrome P450 6B7-like [Pectinophora gossypiella]|uniref:cytochrome P450 6B7-like n=1 Tax=Pectinophora gossypiella TaxID=13191 RepID=UPI00214F2436|nr:cytochrome P450 6B7-like [Pectinophora gossypiella]
MITIAIVAILIVLFYHYGKRNFDYWAKQGVKHDHPIPFFGTDARRYFLQKSVTDMAAEVYWKYPKERFVGYFRGNKPELVIRDPDLIKQIIVNDFTSFYRRGLSQKHKVMEPLLRNLFFVDGDLWRLLRQRMTPAFSSGKLRGMFPLVCEKATRLQTMLTKAEQSKTLDARDVMARYTTDFIGSVGFGLDPDSINDDNSEFRKLGLKIFAITPTRAITTILKSLFPYIFKNLKFLGQEVEDEILGIVNSIQKQRNYKPSGRNDFIDLLLELKEKGKIVVESLERVNRDGTPETVEMEMDDELMAAQAFIFFAAGFETSSSATSFTLHQLAFNPEVQKKVQADIDKVLARYDDKLCFDAIKEMHYLEWTFLEAMRMFPSSGYLMRQCTKKYTIPGTSVTIDEGFNVVIPLQAIHNDPQYFENPTEFRPERFSPEEVAKRHKYVYLPFGEGPRSCIGGRLGKMQSIAGLAAVLSRFSVVPSEETKFHLEADPKTTIVQNVVGGIPLRFVKRTDVGDVGNGEIRETVLSTEHSDRTLA